MGAINGIHRFGPVDRNPRHVTVGLIVDSHSSIPSNLCEPGSIGIRRSMQRAARANRLPTRQRFRRERLCSAIIRRGRRSVNRETRESAV